MGKVKRFASKLETYMWRRQRSSWGRKRLTLSESKKRLLGEIETHARGEDEEAHKGDRDSCTWRR